MKVLILSYKFFPDVGGIETISEILAEGFSKAGHDVKLVTFSREKTFKRFSFEILRDPSPVSLYSAHYWADLVFENNPSIRLSWPMFLLRKPSIVSLQTWILSASGKSKNYGERLKYLRLKQASCVIACSEAVKLICWPKALVVGNPYKSDTFRVLTSVERTKDFIFLGRLVSDKGVDLAIRAFDDIVKSEQLRNGGSTLNLTIIGDGPERSTIEKMIQELNLERHVSFGGILTGEELVACLNEHRIILVPSVWEEPFGIVVLEGIACGCVPIVSNCGGLPDAAGKAGLTFERGDYQSLSHSMRILLENPQVVNELKEAAAAHLKAHTAQEITSKYLSIMNGISA